MNDQNRHDPSAAAPAREPQREGGERQRQGDQSLQQRGGGDQNLGGRRNMRRRHGGGREGQPQQSQASRSNETSINMDELRELFGLIGAQGFTEFELEKEGFRVRLRRDHHTQAGTGSHGAQSSQPVNSLSFTPPPQATQAASGGAHAEATTGATAGTEEPTAGAVDEAALFKLTSPIVGTFYRAASPEAEPFVKVGSHVDPETVVCIVEAMKLMNEILSEASGTIEKIYVENGQPVEFGQALFGIRK
ncbi:MAG: acetyl-CoA carboxylase biotin carboxyl carrier protein [Acidobacteria bacterium]|nr:acetyl-CoA carboxylase biotin carboxyl carrier protein [Acidobacteriota bacterium]